MQTLFEIFLGQASRETKSLRELAETQSLYSRKMHILTRLGFP